MPSRSPIADRAARLFATALVGCLIAALPCPADECWAPLGRADARLLGNLSCASTSCHGRKDAATPSDSSRGREYAVWLEHDPHARAPRTIRSTKFQNILKAMVGEGGDEARRLTHQRCAACHDPQGYADVKQGRSADAQVVGFACESCHGAAEHWLTAHYERDVSREQLRELGLVDTKNLLARARQCARCHVGDAERNMNHDMIAAGHPPLRFELSAYHDRICRKHWTDAERIDTPHFKAQLWAAGQVAVAEATLALLEARAQCADGHNTQAPWPELAEYDCFACHQRLRPIAAVSNVSLRAAPGVPGWQPWNFALAEPLAGGEKLVALRQGLASSLFADPAQTRRLAAEARQELREHPLSQLLCGTASDSFSAGQLTALVQRSNRPDQSWAESSQQLLALQAAYLAWRDQVRMLRLNGQLVSSQPRSRWPPVLDAHDRELQSRLTRLSSALRFGWRQFEWPAFDWQGLPPLDPPPELADSAAVARELMELAEVLGEGARHEP